MSIFRGGVLMSCLILGLLVSGCSEGSVEEKAPDIAVTNSYLESVVQDLCGSQTKVMCLAPPGMCPGHFDISPAQVRQLQGCRMLLLFDFQSQVESTLSRLKDNGLKTHLIEGPTGLCVPDSYLGACREVAAILASEYPQDADALALRLEEIEQRLGTLSGELRRTVADSGSASAGVLTSHHQGKFAEWLGLEIVATFVGSDTETIASVDHCLKQAVGQDVRFVIANRQEGTALAQALAERLKARAVVFSNFHALVADGPGFDRLLRDNVECLLAAVAE
jgi:zinc/manganese transport system substrate-binding protein